MSMYTRTIDKITNYVIENTSEKDNDEIEIIRYGIEVLVMNISKLIVIYFIAFLGGYIKETLLATVIFGLIRRYASGLHVKGFLKCLSFSIIVFVFIVGARSFFDLSIYLRVIISLVMIAMIYLYSPADTRDKPYLDEEDRKSLRLSALIVSIIYSLIWISGILGGYSNYFITTLIAQVILINPISYKLLGLRYRNYLYEEDYI